MGLRNIAVRAKSFEEQKRELYVLEACRDMNAGDAFTFDTDPREDTALASLLMKVESLLRKRGLTLATEQGGPRQGRKWWALPVGHPDTVRVPVAKNREAPPDWNKLVPVLATGRG